MEVNEGTWYRNTLDQRVVITDLVVVSTNLEPYVMGTGMKGEAELSTEKLIMWQERLPDGPH